MQDDTYDAIEEKWLDRRDMFGLKFNSGYVFFEVTDYADAKFKPYSEFSDLPSESSYSNFQRVEDANGDDVLFVPNEDSFKIIHAAVGHRPAFLRRFVNYNGVNHRLGEVPNLGSPVASDTFGYIDGYDSEYENPSSAQEFWIPHGVHPTFNFYNPDNDEHTPKLNIKMRKYEVRPLDPRRKEDSDAIRRIAAPGSPMPLPSAGTLDSQIPYDSTLENEWNVPAIGLAKARKKDNNGGV